MTIEKFEAAIKRRANEQVQEQIAKFIDTTRTALRELCDLDDWQDAVLALHARLSGGQPEWPASLWEDAEKELTENALDRMDLLQRIHLAREPTDEDAKPAEKESTTT